MIPFRILLPAAALLLLGPASARAVTPGFTEDFPTDVSGWEDNVNDPMSWVESGGPDGSSYASTVFDFTDFVPPFEDSGPIVFRAHQSDDASGGAFVGDWNGADIREVRALVRHDAPVSMKWIVRLASSFNFPAVAFSPADTVVPPNEWTEIVFDVHPDNPDCTPETFGEETCEDLMDAIGNFQLGTDAPQQVVEGGIAVTLDVDLVTLVPEPGAPALGGAALAALAALAGLRRRNRT